MPAASNTTPGNWTWDSMDRHQSVAFLALLIGLTVIGTLANGYILVVLLKKSRPSSFHMSIVNLAIVDSLILLLVIPMCLVTLTLSDVTTSLCSVAGVLGQLLSTYSLHVQIMILYVILRNVTAVSPDQAGVGLVRLVVISGACLTVDTWFVIYPSVKHGVLRKLPSVGYCILTIKNEIVWQKLMLIFYAIHMSASVFACSVFHIILTRFVHNHSARPTLARRRQMDIFKVTLRKILIWVLCYSLVSVARFVGYKNEWPEVMFQVSYFLLWSNSVLNPLCFILTSPLRSVIFPCCVSMATVTQKRHSQLTIHGKSFSDIRLAADPSHKPTPSEQEQAQGTYLTNMSHM